MNNNMKKEQKVISLKLAQELQRVAKEKNFKLPESEYVWTITITTDWHISNTDYDYLKKIDKDVCRAYDTAELGEILPKYQEKWIVGYTGDDENKNTEAEARGKLLVYLIKNNKIIKWKK